MLTSLCKKLSASSDRRDYRTVGGASLLHIAAENDDFLSISEFIHLDKFDPNVLNQEGETALVVAIRHNSYQSSPLLLRNGCDPNIITNTGDSALLWAAYTGHISTFKMLVEYGANIKHKYNDGRDAFLWAIYMDRISMIEYMIKNIEINWNIMDIDGKGWRDVCKSMDMILIIDNHISKVKQYFCLWLLRQNYQMLDIMLLNEIGAFISKK